MKKYQWINKNDSWPDSHKNLILETNQGLCIGHTNSTQDVVFDAYLITNGFNEERLDIIRWKYITKTQHNFLLDNLESFNKFNK